jgi:DNA-binding response OmpR family regulator
MKIENEKLVLKNLNDELKNIMSVPEYQIGAYKFDSEKRTLNFKTDSIKLTRKEAYLLCIFAANFNNFLDRRYILESIWGEDNYLNSRSMDVYICKLRKLLSKDKHINLINFHGKGYKMIKSA